MYGVYICTYADLRAPASARVWMGNPFEDKQTPIAVNGLPGTRAKEPYHHHYFKTKVRETS